MGHAPEAKEERGRGGSVSPAVRSGVPGCVAQWRNPEVLREDKRVEVQSTKRVDGSCNRATGRTERWIGGGVDPRCEETIGKRVRV
jgi:hypothetical protein